jgi:hypothetical protein
MISKVLLASRGCECEEHVVGRLRFGPVVISISLTTTDLRHEIMVPPIGSISTLRSNPSSTPCMSARGEALVPYECEAPSQFFS